MQENDQGSMPAASQPLPQAHATAVFSSVSVPSLGAKPKNGVSLVVSLHFILNILTVLQTAYCFPFCG